LSRFSCTAWWLCGVDPRRTRSGPGVSTSRHENRLDHRLCRGNDGLLQEEASKRRFVPDSTACATQVPAGRPLPWMCLQNAMNPQIYPMEAFVKVGDMLPDVEEGLNAGMWTFGWQRLAMRWDWPRLRSTARSENSQSETGPASRRMRQAGAHYVVNGIADVSPVLDEINVRLAAGERPWPAQWERTVGSCDCLLWRTNRTPGSQGRIERKNKKCQRTVVGSCGSASSRAPSVRPWRCEKR